MNIIRLLSQPAPIAAAGIIGWSLIRHTERGSIGGIIVETEAYTASDPASHSFRGQTIRNTPMFGSPGTIYIYFTYGMHYCLNIVAGSSSGEAVLIRALEPTIGIELMKRNRGTDNIKNLCSGPAKLVQALGIQPNQNNTHINDRRMSLIVPEQPRTVAAGPRIGIKKATGQPWRFYDANSQFCSRIVPSGSNS